MTHCSVCGRKLRSKTMPSQAGPSNSFPAPWTDWLNHRRDCSRYGQPPDAGEGGETTDFARLERVLADAACGLTEPAQRHKWAVDRSLAQSDVQRLRERTRGSR